jgi:hypothetical protein
MSSRMDWRRARLHGRKTIDHRFEHDVRALAACGGAQSAAAAPADASRWLGRSLHQLDHARLQRGAMVNGFDFPAKRRQEIVLHARLVGAMDTEDRSEWLIAWALHNRKAADQIWSVMEAAKRMGGAITDAEAAAIAKEASNTRKYFKYLKADSLARCLGVTFAQRQRLRLKTIGSVDVNKHARKDIRRIRDKVKKEWKRRANGVQPRAEYELNSTAAIARAQGVSRMTIYRRRKRAAEQARDRPDVTCVSAVFSLPSADGPVTGTEAEGASERSLRARKQEKEASGLPSSRTATKLAADRFASLPLELRLLALGLPIPEERLGKLRVREVHPGKIVPSTGQLEIARG